MGNMTHDGIGQATSLSTETRPLPTVSLVPISDADQPANVGAVRIAAASSGSNVSLFPDISGASAAGKGSAPAVVCAAPQRGDRVETLSAANAALMTW